MIEKIKRLCEIYSNKQPERDRRFKEFQNFQAWCIANIPKGMLPEDFEIDKPIVNNDSYAVQLNGKDYFWWSKAYAKHPDILMKEVEYYQKIVASALMDKILEYPQDTKEELEKVIVEIQNMNK